LRANIDAGVLVQSGALDRELVLLAWLALFVTEIAQAKARIRKSVQVELNLELITEASSRTNFSPATFIVSTLPQPVRTLNV
jgi:hypothetical protein